MKNIPTFSLILLNIFKYWRNFSTNYVIDKLPMYFTLVELHKINKVCVM